MGYAVAREAVRRGAAVILVSGPVSIAAPPGVRVVPVERAEEMRDAVLAELPAADALVMAAAPADFVAARPASRKIKRAAGLPDIPLALAPDILAEVRKVRRAGQVVVAFAAETENLLANARRKLADKGADLLVANDVSRPGAGFDAEENEVTILAASPDARGPEGPEEEAVPRASKEVVAGRILDRLAHLVELRCPRTEETATR